MAYSIKVKAKLVLQTAVFLTGITATAVFAQDFAITATVDKASLVVGDQLLLTLQITKAGGGGMMGLPDPQVSLPDVFQVIGQNQSQSFNMSNFQVTASKVIYLTLVPTVPGRYTLGPFTVDSAKSEPIEVEVVSTGGAPPQGGGQAPAPQGQAPEQSQGAPGFNDSDLTEPLAVRAQADKTEVWVGEQVLYQWMFYQSSQSNAGVDRVGPEFPDFTGFWVEDIEGQGRFNKIINRRQYVVSILKKALFPTAPGLVTIPAPRAQLSYDPFFTFGFRRQRGSAPESVTGNPLLLTVKPLPENGKPPGFTGTVGNFTIDAHLDKQEVKAGTPVTLTVLVRGQGNMKSVPTYSTTALEDFKSYEPKITQTVSRRADVVGGQIQYEFVLIPKSEGRKNIHPFELAFFNPERGSYQVQRTPPLVLNVLPGEKQDFGQAPPPIVVNQGSEVKALGGDIRFIKTAWHGESPGRTFLLSRGAAKVFLLLPWLLLPAAALYKRRSDKYRTDIGFARRQRAKSQARKHLAGAKGALDKGQRDEFFAELARGIISFIADKLNLPAAGLTSAEIETVLRERRTSEESLREILDLLSTCDMGRFAPAASGKDADQKLLDRAGAVLETLERHLK